MVQFVIEHCINCHQHKYYTRHSAVKYENYADKLQNELGGQDRCLKNEVPATWRKSPIFKPLSIEKTSSKVPLEEQVTEITPRVGAFELFVNIGEPQGKTVVVNLFSKKISGEWPLIKTVAKRALTAIAQIESGADLREIEAEYTIKKGKKQQKDSNNAAATQNFT